MPALKWKDADEIAWRLWQADRRTDPLTVRFTDLHRLVTALEGFDDDSAGGGEDALEAIQMAWLEYFRSSP